MDDTLLAKYIFQEASETEKAKVEKWLSASKNNQRELEKLRERLDLATRRYRPGTFNPHDAYQHWQTSVSPTLSKHRFPMFRYAAAALLFLFLGTGLVYYFQKQQVKTLIAQCASGETLEIILPDSSRVTLAGPATLTYPSRFTTPDRNVSMSGKAYFQVHKDSLHPFLLKTPSIQIGVLGTSFQVQANQQEAEVFVESGKVVVTAPNNTTQEILTAGMSSVWSTQTDQLTSGIEFNANKLAWKTKIIKFKDTPLAEVVQQLNEYFKVNIDLPDLYKPLKLTATFNNQSLPEILEIINQTLNIQLIVPKQ